MQLFRFLQVKTTDLRKWHIFLAGLFILIVVFLLSYIDRLLFIFFLAPWIPLFLVLIDTVFLLGKRQLVPMIILISLIGLILLGPISLIFETPRYFYDLHHYVYIVACLLCIILNIVMVIREPSRIFVATAKVLVFLCTVFVLLSLLFHGDPYRWISLWVWGVFVIAPILGIIHQLRLFYTGNIKKPIGSIVVICLLSIPLIIGAIHIWTLYMPSVITSEKFHLYGKWLEWYESWGD